MSEQLTIFLSGFSIGVSFCVILNAIIDRRYR